MTEDDSFVRPSDYTKSAKRRRQSEPVETPQVPETTITVPSKRIQDYESSFPPHVVKQAKLFFKCCLGKDFSVDVWPSILINGPPFCGKSLLVESLAGSFNANYLCASVGVITPNIRTWRDLVAQAKKAAPCVLHLDDVESMEKHSIPVGQFRLTCLLKSQLLKELIGSGVILVGETRSLFANLPQSILDLFTQRITFGMMEEVARSSLLSKYFVESPPAIPNSMLVLQDLTIKDLAKKTPGYEAGDLLRLIAQLKMSALSQLEDDAMETQSCPISLNIHRELLDSCLDLIVPAVKSTSEFVTIPDITWKDVGGLESTKQELHNRFMLLIDDWERAQILGRKSNGILLEGPPGCGKTLIAKALSNCAGLNFLSVKGPEVLNKYQGESERRIREIFERARACQPCMIFFDEIDAICPTRDGDEATGSRVSLVNQLLVELDGVDKHRSQRLFVVGATNRKDMIDPAILRPGRLGLHLRVHPPRSADERLSVLAASTKNAEKPRIENGLKLLEIVASDPRTDGFSGAELDNLLDLAKLNAHIAKRNFLNSDDLFAALDELTQEKISKH
ncbi:hypothetical protein Ciccas_010289 [Cichlidogyrus casuarinus]|uniref:AAA+ ATPase domain-containing protein n=1 Tax=Cichlidogyrus casuarinus TaxID=1844966 RepID=A0ABD2PVP9_9PLAT